MKQTAKIAIAILFGIIAAPFVLLIGVLGAPWTIYEYVTGKREEHKNTYHNCERCEMARLTGSTPMV